MTITVTMSDDAYRTLRSALSVKALAGNAYGAVDAFATAFVKAVDAGHPTVEIKTRREREQEGETP